MVCPAGKEYATFSCTLTIESTAALSSLDTERIDDMLPKTAMGASFSQADFLFSETKQNNANI